jgi:hypothetical protein
MYPKDRIYAADFKGKAWTVTFRRKDPVTFETLGKGGASEKSLPVWHFDETTKKMPAVVTNGVCARAMFGDESDDWGGHKITLFPAPDPSGLSDDGLCIRVQGSPELTEPLKFQAQIGRTKKTFQLVPTPRRSAPVQHVEAEATEEDASAAQEADYGAPTSSEGEESSELFGGGE